MTRRLLNLLTALSLMLSVAVVALWVRSYFAQDIVAGHKVTTTRAGFRWWEFSAATWKGVVRAGAVRHEFERVDTPAPLYDGYLQEAQAMAFSSGERRWRSRRAENFPATTDHPLSSWGFTCQLTNERGGGHRGFVIGGSSPWWFVLLLCSFPLDVRMLFRLRRARRRRISRCPTCNYDLTGNVSGVCPECGETNVHAI